MMDAEKLMAYLTGRSIVYTLKHPVRAIKFMSKSENYLTFVSDLLEISKHEIMFLQPESKSLRNLRLATKKSIIPSNQENPLDFESSLGLYLIARVLKPRIVIETGVSAGRSSAFILQALCDNGRGALFSIDPNQNSGYAVTHELRRRWRFMIGTSDKILPDLVENLEQIDVFIHDSLHTYENMMLEYQVAWPYIRDGGVLLSDDVDWNNAFTDFATKARREPLYMTKRFAAFRK